MKAKKQLVNFQFLEIKTLRNSKTLINQSVSEESSPAYTKKRIQSSSSSERPVKKYAKKMVIESSSSLSIPTPKDPRKNFTPPLSDEIMELIQRNAI